jgi:hypothetical protein
MDNAAILQLLDTIEQLAAPVPTSRKRARKPAPLPNLSPDQAWATLDRLVGPKPKRRAPVRDTQPVSADSPSSALRERGPGGEDPTPGAENNLATAFAELASPQVHEASSTYDFPISELASSGAQAQVAEIDDPDRGLRTTDSSTAGLEPGDTVARVHCPALTRHGKPCRSYPRAGREHCYFHDIDSAEELQTSTTRAGLASGIARRKPAFEIDNIVLGNTTGIQLALDALFRLELSGALPNFRTKNLVRILSVASRRIPNDPEVDMSEWSDFVDQLNEELPEVVNAQRSNDSFRAAEYVGWESMSRSQFAVDVERWPVLDRRPTTSRKLDVAFIPRSARDHPDYR